MAVTRPVTSRLLSLACASPSDLRIIRQKGAAGETLPPFLFSGNVILG